MRVVICGAGIAGLALAGRLHNVLGWEVVVLEKEPRPRTDGYMLDFFGPGYDAAEAMGMLPSLEELSYRVSEAALVDDHGECRVGLRYDRFARFLDGRLLSIMRPDLELALRERLSLAVRLRFGVGPASVDAEPDGVRVTLTDGDSIDADLLVGADGIHSTVRALVFGEEARYVHHLGYHTAALTFDDPGVHAEVDDRFCLTDTIGRQMGLYALRDGAVAVFVVHRATDAPCPRDVQAALRHEYGMLGWLVPRVLANCPPSSRIYYAHVAQTTLPAWSRGRVVLVGDACQAVSLLAAQGASLAMGAAYVLADQLAYFPHRGRTARLRTALAARHHAQAARCPARGPLVRTRITTTPAGPPRRPAALQPARCGAPRRHLTHGEAGATPAPTRLDSVVGDREPWLRRRPGGSKTTQTVNTFGVSPATRPGKVPMSTSPSTMTARLRRAVEAAHWRSLAGLLHPDVARVRLVGRR